MLFQLSFNPAGQEIPAFHTAEQESTKIRFQLEERSVREQHVFPPSFARAELKLKMAERLTFEIESLLDSASGITRQQRMNGQEAWDEKKCVKLLKGIGYENPETAFRQLSLSTFEERLGRAREEIQRLNELGANSRNQEFSLDCARAANAQASAILSEFTSMILWEEGKSPGSLALDPANPLSHRLGGNPFGGASTFTFFDELVDAHSYLAYSNMQNLYFAAGQVNGREEYVANQNTSLDKAYERLLHSSTSGLPPGEYAEDLKDFYSAYSSYSQKQESDFLRRQGLSELKGLDKLHFFLEPYANASVPIIMAAVMATPAGLPMGTLYFASDAKKAFEEGRIAEGILISATLSAPFFSAVRGAAAPFSAASKIGTAGMQASHAAGTIFQLQMAGSLVSLSIDCARYGMSAEDVAALGQTIGFLGMPLAVEKAHTGKFTASVRGPMLEFGLAKEKLSEIPLTRRQRISAFVKSEFRGESEEAGLLRPFDENRGIAEEALLTISQKGMSLKSTMSLISRLPADIYTRTFVVEALSAAAGTKEGFQRISNAISILSRDPEVDSIALDHAAIFFSDVSKAGADIGKAADAVLALKENQTLLSICLFYLKGDPARSTRQLEILKDYLEALGDTRYLRKILQAGGLYDLRPLDAEINRLSPFLKTGGELVPLGGRLTGLLVRVVEKEAADSWKSAYDAGIPCEEFVRAYPRKGGKIAVITKFAGETLPDFVEKHPEMRDEALAQKGPILKSLEEKGIRHMHPHDQNFTVQLVDGKPLVRIIDFDLAKSPPQFISDPGQVSLGVWFKNELKHLSEDRLISAIKIGPVNAAESYALGDIDRARKELENVSDRCMGLLTSINRISSLNGFQEGKNLQGSQMQKLFSATMRHNLSTTLNGIITAADQAEFAISKGGKVDLEKTIGDVLSLCSEFQSRCVEISRIDPGTAKKVPYLNEEIFELRQP